MREEVRNKHTVATDSAPTWNIMWFIIKKNQPNKQTKKNYVVKLAQKNKESTARLAPSCMRAPLLWPCVPVCVRPVCARSSLESSLLMILPGFFRPPPSYLDLVQPSWSGSLPCTTDRGEHILPAPPVHFGWCVLRTCWRAFKQII